VIIPDYRGAWLALESIEHPVVSFHEMCTHLAEWDELKGPATLYVALEEMVRLGSVLVLHRRDRPALYALRQRLLFRRDERRGRGQPWAS
jgi:hypothetical protein